MNDGGPAFPTHSLDNGIRVRDYFAYGAPVTLEHALVALDGRVTNVDYDMAFKWLAQMRFAYADAMLKERSRTTEK